MAKLYDWLMFAYVYVQRGSNTSDKNINIRNDALTTADKCHDRLKQNFTRDFIFTQRAFQLCAPVDTPRSRCPLPRAVEKI